MYYFDSNIRDLRIIMPLSWEKKFEQIKWNEGEEVNVEEYAVRFKLKTVPGYFQGLRNWIYETYRGDKKVDEGRIIDYLDFSLGSTIMLLGPAVNRHYVE
jgi:hypothetical protein